MAAEMFTTCFQPDYLKVYPAMVIPLQLHKM
jgi:histone acetyltransferase (RNA polymerase elongator complex component)